jgi:hypothetical protein
VKRFVLSLACVLVIWLLLLHFPPPRWLDIVILLGVAAVYTVGWLQMLIFRRIWTTRATGIFWTAMADATVYLALGLAHFGHVPNWAFDLARAAFIVGAPLFAFGTIRYLTRDDDPSDTTPTGLP